MPSRFSRWDSFVAAQRHSDTPPPPWLQHYLQGIELCRAGRHEDALATFRRARDANPRGRAPSMLNERLRELSAAHPHVQLVDFERRLDRIGLEEGIGCNFFGDENRLGGLTCDGVHPNIRTNELIGSAIAEKMIWARRRAERRARDAERSP